MLRWLDRCPGLAGACLLVGASDGLWRWSRERAHWDHLLALPSVFAATPLGDRLYAGGQGFSEWLDGAEHPITNDAITSVDTVMADTPWLVLGGLQGNLWRWRPGDAALDPLVQHSPAGITTIFVLRAATQPRLRILVGSDAGLHIGTWQSWYERR